MIHLYRLYLWNLIQHLAIPKTCKYIKNGCKNLAKYRFPIFIYHTIKKIFL